jgi:hypothetical protein
LVLCTLVVILTNLAVSILFQGHWKLALLTSVLGALLLLGAGQILKEDPEMTLPSKIMQRFGFGGQNVTLVLTERGGRILCQHQPTIHVDFERVPAATCANPPASSQDVPSEDPKKGAKQEQGYLARVAAMTILSRLGSEYLLRYGKGTTIALPKELVVSWSISKAPDAPKLRPTSCR